MLGPETGPRYSISLVREVTWWEQYAEAEAPLARRALHAARSGRFEEFVESLLADQAAGASSADHELPQEDAVDEDCTPQAVRCIELDYL